MKLPSRLEIYQTVSSFSVRQKVIFIVLAIICLASFLGLVWALNNKLVVRVAVAGGKLTEGIVGFPSHGNPLFAITDADRDVAALVYSGLMKIDASGHTIPDLAKTYTVSSDGLIYTFQLKNDLTWQDGKPLTTDDIVFTINLIQKPGLNIVHRAAWEGVKVEKISDQEIRFTLKKAYSGFLDNTTIGILPEHVWSDSNRPESVVFSDYNVKSVGSGPYQITDITRDSTGLPQSYTLKPFAGYALGEPKISTLVLHFYSDTEEMISAYQHGEIESLSGISAVQAEKLEQENANVRSILLSRTFAVFLNRNLPALADKNIRQALSLAVDRSQLIEQVLAGNGSALYNPIPPGSLGFLEEKISSSSDLTKADQLMSKAGWKRDMDKVWTITDSKGKTTRLEFNLATSDTPELKATAETLTAQWRAWGAIANISIYELSDLDQNLIRPRKFEALLFGEVVGRDPDLYPFWHSSQRLTPGLNITQYANSVTDKLLEQARQADQLDDRAEINKKFQMELAKDTPAIFLYAPHFLYILPTKIKNTAFPSLLVPAERFSAINNWYINEDKIWKIFANVFNTK